jgi:hypothetical protein
MSTQLPTTPATPHAITGAPVVSPDESDESDEPVMSSPPDEPVVGAPDDAPDDDPEDEPTAVPESSLVDAPAVTPASWP